MPICTISQWEMCICSGHRACRSAEPPAPPAAWAVHWCMAGTLTLCSSFSWRIKIKLSTSRPSVSAFSSPTRNVRSDCNAERVILEISEACWRIINHPDFFVYLVSYGSYGVFVDHLFILQSGRAPQCKIHQLLCIKRQKMAKVYWNSPVPDSPRVLKHIFDPVAKLVRLHATPKAAPSAKRSLEPHWNRDLSLTTLLYFALAPCWASCAKRKKGDFGSIHSLTVPQTMHRTASNTFRNGSPIRSLSHGSNQHTHTSSTSGRITVVWCLWYCHILSLCHYATLLLNVGTLARNIWTGWVMDTKRDATHAPGIKGMCFGIPELKCIDESQISKIKDNQ